jgi:hypothetical protein
MFPGSATFAAPSLPTEVHGDPVIGGETGGTVLSCYAEPDTRGQGRDEGYHVPVVRQRWLVYTPTDPGAGIDWLCTWDGRHLRVTAPSAKQDGWNLWRTDCIEVN